MGQRDYVPGQANPWKCTENTGSGSELSSWLLGIVVIDGRRTSPAQTVLICPLAKSTVNPGNALLIQKWTKGTQIWVFGEGLVGSGMIHTEIHGTAKQLHAGGFGGISI